jgi:hypothetical protein
LQLRAVSKVWPDVDVIGKDACGFYGTDLSDLQDPPESLVRHIVNTLRMQEDAKARDVRRIDNEAPDDIDQLVDHARWCFQNCPNDIADRTDVLVAILGLKASLGDRAEELRSDYDTWMDKYPAGNSDKQKDNLWNSKPDGRTTIGSFFYHLCTKQDIAPPRKPKANNELKDFWFVGTLNKYLNVATGDVLHPEAVNSLHGNNSTNDILKEDRKAIRCEYRPDLYDADDPTFTDEGTLILNSYNRPRRRYITGSLQSPQWAKVEELVSLSISDAQERHSLLQWLCHNIRYPGTKVRWAILYQGPNGSGKDTLVKLLQMGLGVRGNVKMVGGSELNSNFNSYSGNACVAVLEEVRIEGRNKWKVYNELKAPITNDYISVHGKGSDGRTFRNVTNYFASTNYDDAVPIDSKGDRRWYVVACQWQTKEECLANGLDQAFYDELHSLLENAEDIIWSAAQDYSLDGFSPNQIPADTAAKQKMVQATRSQLSRELDDVLDNVADSEWYDSNDGYFLTQNVINEYKEAYQRAMSKSDVANLGRAMDELGYVSWNNGAKIAIKGTRGRVYVPKGQQDITADELRTTLE